MASSVQSQKCAMKVQPLGRHRTTRYFAGAAIVAASLLGTALPAVAAAPPTLAVVVVGSGAVVSRPGGIMCPGTCTATFAAGTNVVLTPQPRNGSRLLRWGGPCTGAGACTVKVSGLTAVAAQFLGGPKTQPEPNTDNYVAVPGRYSGWEGNIVFYVAPGGKSVWNIAVPASLVCTPSGTVSDTLTFLEASVQPDGSFNATRSVEDLDTQGANVKATYTIAGHVHPASSDAPAGATGTWRENVAYPSQPGTSCTSNEQSWTATLTGQALGQKTVVEPGSYSGWEGNIVFSVAPGGRSMLTSPPPVRWSVRPPGVKSATISRSRRWRSCRTGRSPRRPLRRACSTAPTRSSLIPSPGTSRTHPARSLLRPGYGARLSCSPVVPARCATRAKSLGKQT